MDPNQTTPPEQIQPEIPQNSQFSFLKSAKVWPIIVLLALLIPTGTYFLGKNQSNNQIPVVRASPTPAPDPTANWIEYKYSKYNFSFKYPPQWRIENVSSISNLNKFSSQLPFELRKNNEIITFWFGILPESADPFAYEYWGFGNNLQIIGNSYINGVKVFQDKWEDNEGFNLGTIFNINSTNKLYAVANPNRNCKDSECKPISQDFEKETNQILSTFKFTQ